MLGLRSQTERMSDMEQAIAQLANLVNGVVANGSPTDTNLRHESQLLRQEMDARLKRVEDALVNRNVTCPYRDDIRRSANNLERIDELDKKLDELDQHIRRTGVLPGAAGGGIGAVVAAALLLIGKYLGWW